MANEVDYTPCQYLGNGQTRDFPFNWKVIEVDELIVELETVSTGYITTLQRGVYYTATINAVGGNVALTTAPSEDYYVNISRKTSNYQSKGYSTSTGFQGSEIEKSFDKVSCCLQDMEYNIEKFQSTFSEDIEEFKNEVNETIEEVIEAATKINQFETAVATCISKADEATHQATIATEKSNEIQVNASQITTNTTSISTINQTLKTKATRSLDNLTDEGKKLITGYSFPSSTEYIDLSYNPTIYKTSWGTVVRLSKYKAPANGFLVMRVVVNNANVTCQLTTVKDEPSLTTLLPDDSDVICSYRVASTTSNGQGIELSTIAAKNQWIYIAIGAGETPYLLRFNYAQGEV